MDKRNQIKIILAAIVSHGAWGFSFLASRKGLDAAPVFVLLSHRFGLSFLTMNLLVPFINDLTKKKTLGGIK